jgi:N-ethylmaleimide reductase
VVTPARAAFHGALVGNLGYTAEEAAREIENGTLAAVAFGRPFISNPDLVERLQSKAPLAEPNPQTFYAPGPKGYIDYPALSAA